MEDKILKYVWSKLFSGKFIMTVCFSVTYCFIMVGVTAALLLKLIQTETYVALLGGFALVVKGISDNYFNRKNGGKDVVSKS